MICGGLCADLVWVAHGLCFDVVVVICWFVLPVGWLLFRLVTLVILIVNSVGLFLLLLGCVGFLV